MFQLVWSLVLWTLVVWWGLFGCSVYDVKSTVQVYSYPPPKISDLSITESGVVMTINSGMYFPSHEDFDYYVLLFGSPGTDFQSDIDNATMGDFTTVNEIPNYLQTSDKPSVSGSYLNAITVTINLNNFQSLKTYDFTAIAYGYNESYGRLYDNNGWLYSKIATSHALHIPIIVNGTIKENQALVINNDKWEVSSNTSMSDSLVFVFATNITSEQHDVMMAQGNVGINPLGYVSGSTILPVDDYVNSQANNYFVVVSKHSYALKNLSNNTYARLIINSVRDTTIDFQLFYSTNSGERKF